jgi:hypothetical protein
MDRFDAIHVLINGEHVPSEDEARYAIHEGTDHICAVQIMLGWISDGASDRAEIEVLVPAMKTLLDVAKQRIRVAYEHMIKSQHDCVDDSLRLVAEELSKVVPSPFEATREQVRDAVDKAEFREFEESIDSALQNDTSFDDNQ